LRSKGHPKIAAWGCGGGLDLRFYGTKHLGGSGAGGLDVENMFTATVDLEGPQVNLITASNNPKDRKKPS